MNLTVGFSESSNRWTSRYSFEPQHYFTVDTQLVSFAPKLVSTSLYDFGSTTSSGGGLGMAFRHDAIADTNKFYGETFPTTFSVVSNQNPSATKEYEAFSIEENDYDKWTVDFYSHDYEASTTSLVQKENDFYGAIPRAKLIKDARISLVGVMNAEDLTFENIASGTLSMTHVEDTQAYGVLLFQRLNINQELNPGSILTAVKASNSNPFTSLPNLTNSQADAFAKVEAVNIEEKTIDVTIDGNPLSVVDPQWEHPSTQVAIFVADTSSSKSLRGDYLRIDFSTEPSPDINVFAINVDMHPITLDHSLGQNN